MLHSRNGSVRGRERQAGADGRPGTPDTNRTCDLPLRRGLLYPLSYRGVGPDSNW